MDNICKTSTYIYSFFVCVVIFAGFANGAPQNHHRHGHTAAYSSSVDDSNTKMEWVNPCGVLLATVPTKFENETEFQPRNPKALKPLRDALPNYILRLNGPNMNAIDTSDISEWFKYNSTYSFLHRINASVAAVNLPKRHRETQKYVAAFQQLASKQKKFDSFQNEGNAKTVEIDHLLVLAKNLLCEIETIINNTRQPMPMVMSREAMDRALKFRNNNNSIFSDDGDIDELDNKFAKVRFHEYVQNLQRVLKRPGKKNLRPRKRGPKFGGPKKGKGKKGTKVVKGKGPRKQAKRKNLRKKMKLPNGSLT
ncbi:uncharacterized protein LOC119068585 isoform X2 [Bradysia coprophila]|uniref:uncharacterized protein LOC119068585 isoform X2 n=1 Tax=Bradysia coprophila TaxID=38358 RepID=UPI00187D9E9C|nr:uncharacterized protein LOC119068585 isoform X2 [Bradysia coprophila]